MSAFRLQSLAFESGAPIPRKFTGDGEDVSPPLAWSDLPPGTQELALILDDPDAPTPEPWVHWVMYRIPISVSELSERIPPAQRVPQPAGAVQGRNSWPKGIGYRGPAPPQGHGVHRYFFRLYALDTELGLEPGVDKLTLQSAIQGHVLGEAELMGTYQR